MNHVVLIGNLTRDPELRVTPNGKQVCSFGLAVTRRFSNAQGERETDFFNITVWGVQGENCAKYLKKGSKAAVSGSIQIRNYEANDGTKRIAVDIQADQVQFLSSPGGGSSSSLAAPKNEAGVSFIPADDEELPF